MDFLVEPDGLTGFERDHHKTLGAPGGRTTLNMRN